MAPEAAAALGITVPPAAKCYRDHASHEGCLFAAAFDKCRGNWILEVFTPLPPAEAEALRQYVGKGYEN